MFKPNGHGILDAPRVERDGDMGVGVGVAGPMPVPVPEAEADERLSALLASAPEAIVAVDARGAVESINPAAERLFGFDASELLGRNFAALIAEPHRDAYEGLATAVAAGSEVELLGLTRSVLGRRSDGSSFPLELSLSRMEVGEETMLLAIGRDGTEREREEERLRLLVDQDPLTGLLNRRAFQAALTEHLEYAARYGRAGSVLILDVDNFKYINDSLGHRAGDELIIGVAALIRGRLRRTDVLARLGGDEFAVLIHAAEGRSARTVAQELREIISGHDFVLERHPIRITASVGVAPLDEPRLTAPEVLTHADVAVYAAKERGRDQAVEFTPEGQAEVASLRAMSEQIRRATEKGLFVLLQQPILDLATDQVSQYELLLRMRGENGTLLEPASFLPTAERFGLIRGIDRWVAQQAVRLIASQRKLGRELLLEVNLSALSMSDSDFVTSVGREMVNTGADPSQLVFEVTETAAVQDLDQARRFADALTRVGCRFALDDFGAGFASFYYLKHLPISYLKIDGEFVKELTRTPTDQLMIKALVQVAKGLGIKTIAEFVGDDDTLELLREFGVDFAQGYHIGRPSPVAELRV